MALLTIVRHGQASFFGADYDQLSDAGHAQSRALGEYWVRHEVCFDTIYVGPRRRHRQTLAGVAAVYAEHGLTLPAPIEVPELDEHDGLTVVRHVLRERGAIDDGRVPADPGGAERERLVRSFFRHYLQIMGEWSRGAVVVPDVESWEEFRTRSLRALDRICVGEGNAAAFTSGGLVSSATGWVLGLDDDRVLELSAVVKNTALTELRHSGRKRSLVTFNALPHLPDPRAVTGV
jgi:broad specificity phosphatase PhoE